MIDAKKCVSPPFSSVVLLALNVSQRRVDSAVKAAWNVVDERVVRYGLEQRVCTILTFHNNRGSFSFAKREERNTLL